MIEHEPERVLDGNAAAGLLQEFFVPEITTTGIQCAGCDSLRAIGALRLYAASMGVVLRCTQCDGVLLRAVHTPNGRWLDMTGARFPMSATIRAPDQLPRMVKLTGELYWPRNGMSQKCPDTAGTVSDAMPRRRRTNIAWTCVVRWP
jgi:hypothetical protein